MQVCFDSPRGGAAVEQRENYNPQQATRTETGKRTLLLDGGEQRALFAPPQEAISARGMAGVQSTGSAAVLHLPAGRAVKAVARGLCGNSGPAGRKFRFSEALGRRWRLKRRRSGPRRLRCLGEDPLRERACRNLPGVGGKEPADGARADGFGPARPEAAASVWRGAAAASVRETGAQRRCGEGGAAGAGTNVSERSVGPGRGPARRSNYRSRG